MAGTRLAIQTTVLVQLLALIAVSFHHGFCRSDRPRGNLTKDLPRVPGAALPEGSPVVETQLWEEIVCRPVPTLLSALLGWIGQQGEDPSSRKNNHHDPAAAATEPTTTEGDGSGSGYLSGDHRLAMTLAFEAINATELPLWIGRLSKELESDPSSTFSILLRNNPMDLKILPPLEDRDPFARWSHFHEHVDPTRRTGYDDDDDGEEHDQHRLVVYIPAAPDGVPDGAILWRAFDAIPGEDTGKETTAVPGVVATLVVPHATTPPHTETEDQPASTSPPPPSLSELQPLVEDWMARAILSNQQRRDRTPPPPTTATGRTRTRIRLTREFPLEHFFAVILPLVFPLLLPTLVSFVKEVKRYRRLTAAKKKEQQQTAAAATAAPAETTAASE